MSKVNTNMPQHLFDLLPEELAELTQNLGHKKFRAQQVWDLLFKNGVKDLKNNSNLPSKYVEDLLADYCQDRLDTSQDLLSRDGTRKWLMKLRDNNEVETVFIPERTRGTLCVSSQVGCTLNCTFCHTGTQRLVRNLTAAEIVLQFMHARDSYGDWQREEGLSVTNIVMMGMGEPLLNYDNVKTALQIIMHPKGMNFARRRITLSTSGIIPAIEKCAKDLAVNLAISLHAVRDDLRNEIVPINKKYPLRDLLNLCRRYPDLSGTDKVTFEYVMLDGINDSDADARELLQIIRGIPCKINLIPFNPWPGSIYKCSSMERIRKFAAIIEDRGYMAPIRKPRGQDIFAACGQLKSASVRQQRR